MIPPVPPPMKPPLPDMPGPVDFLPPGIGAFKEDEKIVAQVARKAKPHINISRARINSTKKVINELKDLLNVTGKTANDVIAEVEELIGGPLGEDRKNNIRAKHPDSGFVNAVAHDEKKQVNTVRGFFIQVSRFLEEL